MHKCDKLEKVRKPFQILRLLNHIAQQRTVSVWVYDCGIKLLLPKSPSIGHTFVNYLYLLVVSFSWPEIKKGDLDLRLASEVKVLMDWSDKLDFLKVHGKKL